MFGSSGKRNSAAVQDFYQRNKHKLVIYAWSILGNYTDAEDAVHSAFTAVLSKIDSNGFIPRDTGSYVYRSVHNRAVDIIRKRSRDMGLIHGMQLQAGSTDPLILQMYNDLNSGLAQLIPDDCRIVVLKVIAGLSFREIEKIMDMPKRTIATRYYRAIKVLKDKLESG
ncbi:RNA polymerase sigma factor [bacterium]|nr:RNA polymerase sigma factor [candidate division CSSED10-310 bacterium]